MLLTRSHCESYGHRQRWALKALNGLVMWVMLSLTETSAAHGAESEGAIIRVEVTDRSEATIDSAARETLARALLQRSGDRGLLEHPAVQAALASARAQLSLFQFERVQGITRFVAHIDQTAL